MFADAKEVMLRSHLEARSVTDPLVLEAMRTVPRENFVPHELHRCAYADGPLPIGCGQTISQPYIVGIMTQMLEIQPGDTVLEIGAGCGYQSAVLSRIAKEVHSVERIPELAETARTNCAAYSNIHLHVGDGWNGWPEKAPYDGIIVTAAPEQIPEPLIQQLKPDCNLVIPVGPSLGIQELQLVHKEPDGTLSIQNTMGVRFVPLISEHSL